MRARRRRFSAALLLAGLCPGIGLAEPMRHVGFVWSSPPQEEIDRRDPRHGGAVAIPERLRALGWTEGTNLRISSISAESRYERFPAIIDEMVRRKVDVVVVFGPEAARAAKQRAGAIPIVWASAFNHPAGKQPTNVTGTAIPNPMLKRVELLRSLVASRGRIAMVARVAPGEAPPKIGPASADAIRAQGFDPFTLYFAEPEELDALFAHAIRERAVAMYMSGFPRLTWDESVQRKIVGLAAAHRLPTVYELPGMARNGALVAFGQDDLETHRRTAYYIDRILRGAKPEDLPMEQPTRYVTTINRTTARALGLTVPSALLLQADEVVD